MITQKIAVLTPDIVSILELLVVLCVCPINIPLIATLAVDYVSIRVENLSGLFH